MSEKMSAEELARAMECECGNMAEQNCDGSWSMPPGMTGWRCTPCRINAHIATLQREADGMREAMKQLETLAWLSLQVPENVSAQHLHNVTRAALARANGETE